MYKSWLKLESLNMKFFCSSWTGQSLSLIVTLSLFKRFFSLDRLSKSNQRQNDRTNSLLTNRLRIFLQKSAQRCKKSEIGKFRQSWKVLADDGG